MFVVLYSYIVACYDSIKKFQSINRRINNRQSGRDVELEVSVMNTDNDDSDMINLDCIHMDVKIED